MPESWATMRVPYLDIMSGVLRWPAYLQSSKSDCTTPALEIVRGTLFSQGKPSIFYKRLTCMVSQKYSSPYCETMKMILLAFSLIDSAVLCLRGARSTLHEGLPDSTWNDTPIDMIVSEGLLWTHFWSLNGNQYIPCIMWIVESIYHVTVLYNKQCHHRYLPISVRGDLSCEIWSWPKAVPPDHFWLPKLVREQILAAKSGPGGGPVLAANSGPGPGFGSQMQS